MHLQERFASYFHSIFRQQSDIDCMQLFWICQNNVFWLDSVRSWMSFRKWQTMRIRIRRESSYYNVPTILSANRHSIAHVLSHLEWLFGKFGQQIAETFSEALEEMMRIQGHLLLKLSISVTSFAALVQVSTPKVSFARLVSGTVVRLPSIGRCLESYGMV